MNSLEKLPTDLTRSRGLALVLTPDKARKECTELIAAFILNGPLFVVAASEWLPGYELTRTIRRSTTRLRQTLSRLYSARASTCYRLFDTLASLPSSGEPVLVLDFLHTFYDDDVPLSVRLFKLRQCCQELKRLALYRPVITITQQVHTAESETFIPPIRSAADKTFILAPGIETIQQLALL
jgi:hypothetical protein